MREFAEKSGVFMPQTGKAEKAMKIEGKREVNKDGEGVPMKLDPEGKKRLESMKKTLAAGLPLAGLLAVVPAGVAEAQVEGAWVGYPIQPVQTDEMPPTRFHESPRGPLVPVRTSDAWNTTAERMSRVALPESEPPWKSLCKTEENPESPAKTPTEEQP